MKCAKSKKWCGVVFNKVKKNENKLSLTPAAGMWGRLDVINVCLFVFEACEPANCRCQEMIKNRLSKENQLKLILSKTGITWRTSLMKSDKNVKNK